MYKKTFIFLLMIILFVSLTGMLEVHALSYDEKIERIDELVRDAMDEAKIPGLSLVIVNKDEEVVYKNYGYRDMENKKKVTNTTLFEIGSNTKAFTGLAIYELIEKGAININDPISKYIPWFDSYFEEKEETIHIRDLIFHTSGIPFNTISLIPQSNSKSTLKETVMEIDGVYLDNKPGEKFLYATVNYVLLGYIIQEVTGESYESYMATLINNKLELKNTFVGRSNNIRDEMARGYKINFLCPEKYEAPIFRGNNPAAYIISNTKDIGKWIQIQLGLIETKLDYDLISFTQTPNRQVAPDYDGSSYAYGWRVVQSGEGEIFHSGNNPNYSSFIGFRSGEDIGVGILANINSEYTTSIGQNTLKILSGDDDIQTLKSDYLMKIGNFSTIVIFSLLILALGLIYGFAKLFRGSRLFVKKEKVKNLVLILTSSVLLLAFIISIYYIPNVFLDGLNWSFIIIWGPKSISYTVIAIIIFSVVIYTYIVLTCLLNSNMINSIILAIYMAIISGIGNATLVFVILYKLSTVEDFDLNLLLFFVLALVIYLMSQRFVRTQLIRTINQLLFKIRSDLILNILRANYEDIEQLDKENIITVLNNDTDRISAAINPIISILTNVFMIISCLIYLSFIFQEGLLVLAFVLCFAAVCYYITSKKANKSWEKNRDSQNRFIQLSYDLINGFKELALHSSKKRLFYNEVLNNLDDYKKTKSKGEINFSNVFVLGEFLFIGVIGSLVFLLPLIFTEIKNYQLQSFIVVLLYITGPVNVMISSIPQLIQCKISWNRTNKLRKKLKGNETENSNNGNDDIYNLKDRNLRLELKDVKYSYSSDNDDFSIGPINLDVMSGEILFIIGGNGSGKSTVGKVICGLYENNEGEISINGNRISKSALSEMFSVIFSDYYLFNKIYDQNLDQKLHKMDKYLKSFQLYDKLEINNNSFSTLKLSSGQKKRLALILRLLEDKPFYLFDEWAAEQDPEFRETFYKVILPELKRKNKGVIVITHDDAYFDVADKIIKMNLGEIELENITQ